VTPPPTAARAATEPSAPSVPGTISPAAPALPAPQVCEQARRSRDPRFDGLFFTAVLSTRVYCRPVCPAPWAKRVVYFATAAAAEAAGFRPCLRCRPELAPGEGTWRRGDAVVARALKLIDRGFLDEQPVPALAGRLGIGARQLRRLFVEHLGAPPRAVNGTRRLLFAKKLLTETRLPVIEVALASGFGSLRRFNAAFRDAYRMAPRDLRRRPRGEVHADGDALALRLDYRPPYELGATLDFLRTRAIPGLEVVDSAGYSRVIAPVAEEGSAEPGWLRVAAAPDGERALDLEVRGVPPGRLLPLVESVRRMFDLDADPLTVGEALAGSDELRPLLRERPGLRLPGGWDGFETAVRAILGQQVSVGAGRRFAARLARRFGTHLETPLAPGLELAFPTPEALADADIGAIGLTRARAETVREMARAVLDGRVDFRAERTLEDFVARWCALPGVGPWTAHYVALRTLGHPDAFPAADLVLRRALASEPGGALSARDLRAAAEAWRPWRAYAVIHLWRQAALGGPMERL
jgi:AraC family transcriptional regulator of adaptative response / DNA-3-methyladenine glycosylase II